VGYNGKDPALLHITEEKSCIIDTTEENLSNIWDIPTVKENLFCCIPQQRKTSFIVSHNWRKPLPLYPTTEETSSDVSHNARNAVALCATAAKKIIGTRVTTPTKIFQLKWFLPMNQDRKWSSLMKIIGGKKFHGTIPLIHIAILHDIHNDGSLGAHWSVLS
jgi:hypothetical protein